MARKRTSIVWVTSRDEFESIVKQSTTLTGIARVIGACPQAGTFKIIKKRIADEGIDASHIRLGLAHGKGKTVVRPQIPLCDVLVEHSTYDRKTLKQRLLKEGILTNRCAVCGLDGMWNGRPLRMRLDHINGIWDDARRDNLRMVCPNCDSQLPTYCNGNIKRRTEKTCSDCNKVINKRWTRCKQCEQSHRIGNTPTKIEWPAPETLLERLRSESMNSVAKSLGVSFHAVKKHVRIHCLQSVYSRGPHGTNDQDAHE